jgi:hypothetical protein
VARGGVAVTIHIPVAAAAVATVGSSGVPYGITTGVVVIDGVSVTTNGDGVSVA